MIYLYVILAIFLSFILSNHLVFILEMPLNMIVVVYVIPCILSYDFTN